jgi:DNA-binding response OmpR family regulator
MESIQYKVLVVDDEESVGRMVVALLTKVGHQCITVQDGTEALDKVGREKFNAVITDIVMPQMDGIALTKELLRRFPDLPIMVMTAHDQDYPAEAAMNAGAQEFIKKPFSIKEFLLRFHKMMKNHDILLKIEAKKNEIIFHSQMESEEKIRELQREIENLKNQLSLQYFSYSK